MCLYITTKTKEKLESERAVYEGSLALKDFVVTISLRDKVELSSIHMTAQRRRLLSCCLESIFGLGGVYRVGRIYIDNSKNIIWPYVETPSLPYLTGYHAVTPEKIYEELLFNPMRYDYPNARYTVRLPVLLSDITAIEEVPVGRHCAIVGRMMLIMDEADWERYKAYHQLSKAIDVASGKLVKYAKKLVEREIEQALETQVPADSSLSQSSVSRV